MYNTTLRLTAFPSDPPDLVKGELVRIFSVVGGLGVPVDNFEISDLTIDVNLGGQPSFPGDSTHPPNPYPRVALGAVSVTGRNNRIRRVRAINFGTRTPNPVDGIYTSETGESFVFWNPGPQTVTEDCILQQPYESTARETTLCLAGDDGSRLRNNYVDMDFVNPLNLVRDNFFSNITTGLFLSVSTTLGTTPPIGRIIFTGNILELSTSGTPAGVTFTVSGANAAIGQFIARDNQIRHVGGVACPTGAYGMSFANILEAIVEENLISVGVDPTNPDQHNSLTRTSTVATIKTFNNRSASGVFLPCWNSTASAHDGDLVADVEAAIMGL